MEVAHLPQLPDAQVRRFLSSMKIDHSGIAPGRKLDKLLRRAIKKAEDLKNLTEAVAEESSGQMKIDPSTLPWCAQLLKPMLQQRLHLADRSRCTLNLYFICGSGPPKTMQQLELSVPLSHFMRCSRVLKD